MEYLRVKRDYLNRLATFWYRLDTNVRRRVGRGADELAQRGVPPREVARLAELQVFARGERHAGGTDDGAAGLEHPLVAAAGEALREALAVAADVGRHLVAVADPEAA